MENQKPVLFKNYKSEPVIDIKSYAETWLKTHPHGEVYVGCDSKARGKKVTYSTVICFWDVGKGVQEIHHTETVPAPKDSYSRLWEEVTRAVNTAYTLKDLGKITVHIDINSNPKYKSHQLCDASIGLITSMGFEGEGKPFSWAASCGAHKHCQ